MLITDLSSECPEPGVYEGVPFDTYNGWRAISNSALTLLDKSPRHLPQLNWPHQFNPIPSPDLGRACCPTTRRPGEGFTP